MPGERSDPGVVRPRRVYEPGVLEPVIERLEHDPRGRVGHGVENVRILFTQHQPRKLVVIMHAHVTERLERGVQRVRSGFRQPDAEDLRGQEVRELGAVRICASRTNRRAQGWRCANPSICAASR